MVILDARTLALTRVLAFWQAYPGLTHGGGEIDSLAVDSGIKIVRNTYTGRWLVPTYAIKVVAAMGTRIVCWSLSGGRAGVWRIHSTLVLPKDAPVTALDCMSGNSILFTAIVIPLRGDLITRVACDWDHGHPICPHSESRGRCLVVDSEMEVPVSNFFAPFVGYSLMLVLA